jgi:hypothetical protein
MAGYGLGNELLVETHDGASYRGYLGQVDPVTQTITLIKAGGRQRQDVLIFRGQDIKRLSEVTKACSDDPAILSRGPVVASLPAQPQTKHPHRPSKRSN